MMKKVIITLSLFLFSISFIHAQDYQTGIGLRTGFYNGFTIKHFIADQTAVEGIITTRWSGFLITGLMEFHRPFSVDRLQWYYGFGGHIGVWNNGKNPYFDNEGGSAIGVDGILGIEYSFSEAPFNISLDWKPAFNLIGDTGFLADGGALSIRYIF
jgi:hypothetical protein